MRASRRARARAHDVHAILAEVDYVSLHVPLYDNVVTTPHVAGATRETSRRRAEVAADNARRVAAGEEARYRVTEASLAGLP